jgi:hypothetical protein
MEISGEGIGIMVIVLGGMLVVTGLLLMVVLYREGEWWGSIVKGMLGVDMPDFGQGGLVPMAQNVIQGLMERTFLYVRIGTLIGGAGVSALGAVLIVIGIYILS